MKKQLSYTWKAQASWGWLALLALLAGMIALLQGDAFRLAHSPRQLREVALILEVYLPLALAILLARLPALDRDAGAAELHLTWRRPAALHLLSLMVIPVALWALAAALTVWVAHATYLPLTARQALAMALYPAAGLAGAALAGSALARHQVGGVLAAALWWAIDLQVPGQVNTVAYLFSTYRPVAGLAPAVMQGRLLLIGLAGLALALWQAGRRERWVSHTGGID